MIFRQNYCHGNPSAVLSVACLFKIIFLDCWFIKFPILGTNAGFTLSSHKELICRGEIPTLNFVEAAYDPFNTQVEYRAPCMSETTRWAPTALSLAISEIAFGIAYVSHIPSLQGGLRDVCRRFSVSHPLSAFSPFHSVRLLSNI